MNNDCINSRYGRDAIRRSRTRKHRRKELVDMDDYSIAFIPADENRMMQKWAAWNKDKQPTRPQLLTKK